MDRWRLETTRFDAGVSDDGTVHLLETLPVGVRQHVVLSPALSQKVRRGFEELALRNPEAGIETYPVGFFSDLRRARTEWRLFHRRRGALRLLVRNVRSSWRRRAYWNGYLAEWHFPPIGMKHSRCGHGWTRRRALASLGAHLLVENLHELEAGR